MMKPRQSYGAQKGKLRDKGQLQNLHRPAVRLRNLIGCIFHRLNQIHLIDDAVFLLNFIKKNGGLPEDAYKKYVKERHESGSAKLLEIEGKTFTWSNYETVLQTLRSASLLEKREGVYKLSRNLSRY